MEPKQNNINQMNINNNKTKKLKRLHIRFGYYIFGYKN